ncbi:anchored repeat-type ABC transporter permease subunit [Cellulomonas bogoriensis]|uniref:ABC transporter ATP-binding protein n=1 Tax=Cellulomonas bogoriensis 69B4 = DSM 16987 TaxID=1386082 RepID=A0A0A0C2D7_9CELL|nr:anchored repeat-type ABC transporter permease subunit [Cellulomonas bogoriensis]KGM13549.1 ABC transporter ATP-binding protein [Cellulomonas bogoriensis 69B4 = DSM 16987]
MSAALEFLQALLVPELTYVTKAALVAVAASIVCGVIGCHVVLRGMAFAGDAVAHAVLPGLAVAFLLQGSLVLGGVVSGVVTAVLIALVAQHRRLRDDAVIGVFFVGAFALGIVLVSRAPGYTGSLQQFLVGSVTGVTEADVVTVLGSALVLLVVTAALHKELVAVSLDRESARAAGLPVLTLDVVLYVLITVAVVISVQTIGTVLVLALLITPPATARMLTDRLVPMMAAAAATGAVAAVVGLGLSWGLGWPAGASVVLVATGIFAVVWLLAPRHRFLVRGRHRVPDEPVPGQDGPRAGVTRPAVPGHASGEWWSKFATPRLQ